MKIDNSTVVNQSANVAAVAIVMNAIATKEKRRGSYPAPLIDTLTQNYSAISPLQFQLCWEEAERLAALFRQTHKERHRAALARHLYGAYQRLTGEGAR
jgi:hypothetical protein